MRRFLTIETGFIITVTLMLAACASIKITPADLTGYNLQAQTLKNPLSNAPQLDVQGFRFSHTGTGGPGLQAYLGHNMGRINENYGLAVYKSVYNSTPDTTVKNLPVLRLNEVRITQIFGGEVDITEQGLANWSLLDPTNGAVLLQLTAHGTAGGESGWGESFAIHGRDRIGRMYQNLLENSIKVFDQSHTLRYIGLVPQVFTNRNDLLGLAKQQWINSNLEEKPDLLAAQRWAAVLKGNSALYHYNRNLIEASSFTELKDEISQIPLAFESEYFNLDIFTAIVQNSSDLDIVDSSGKRPVEFALEKENIDAALILLKYGASARFQLFGDSYISAETYSYLASQLGDSPEQARRIVKQSIAHYRQAISVADNAIKGNEASIWAKNVVNVIGPAIQGMMAGVQARASAQQMANQTGSYGVGVVYYEIKRFDTKDPAKAITNLQALIRHCNQRIELLTKQLAT